MEVKSIGLRKILVTFLKRKQILFGEPFLSALGTLGTDHTQQTHSLGCNQFKAGFKIRSDKIK